MTKSKSYIQGVNKKGLGIIRAGEGIVRAGYGRPSKNSKTNF